MSATNPTTVKILLATGLYPPEIGGPATYARMLEEELPKHGFELVVVPYGQVRDRSRFTRHLAYAKLLWSAAKDIDVVYALDPISVGVPAWVVSFLRRKPLMVRLGGDYAWEQGQQRFGLTVGLDEYTKRPRRAPLAVRVLAAVQTFVVNRARVVVLPSEYLKSIVASWGVPPDRLVVIYSALFPLQAPESRTTLREQLSFTNFTITSVGRLVPWKGFGTLLRCVAALQQPERVVDLVIAGDGPEEASLRSEIERLKVTDRVRLVGRLSKDALAAAIKASDCFVLNTGYEGLSHQLLEVMDLGTPIVTTTVGGNPELIRDGVTGLLVPVNDEAAIIEAITRLRDNEALRARLVQHARVRTHDFAKGKVVLELAQLIREKIIAS